MDDRALRITLRQSGPIPLDVSFTCSPGEVLALFGASGSGKTTILRTIAGLYSPAAARVTLGNDVWLDVGARVNLPPHRRQVGLVFQDYALFPHMTAIGNVMTGLHHKPRAGRRARALELLKLVHLAHKSDSRPSALSGGERQRVAVARALAREPRVLLLDEPFAAVDRTLRHALHAEIDEVRQFVDIPIVLVTHDFDDVVRVATDLAILQAGKLVASGPLEDLTSRADVPWLRDLVGLFSVLDATVGRVDVSRGLAELDFGGGTLLAAMKDLRAGLRVRVRIPAREVILATEPPRGLSLHNALPGSVTDIQRSSEAGDVVVQLQVGEVRLLSQVTADAVRQLGIVPGLRLYALVKSVSLNVLRADGTVRTSSPEGGE